MTARLNPYKKAAGRRLDQIARTAHSARHARHDAQVADVLAAIAQLEALTADAKAFAVRWARDEGVSWPALGRALGVSHQAVQQKYGKMLTDEPLPGV